MLPVPISALQHYSYCPRQCALIHLDHVFDDNILTVRGKLAHERADAGRIETVDGVRIERAVTLWHEVLGLTGKADVIEYHADGRVYPVEYKHGRRHQRLHDDIQLCAQAMCLESMLGISIRHGAIYHISSRRRREVALTARLRDAVTEVTEAVRQLLLSKNLPEPSNDQRCTNCSLKQSCLPDVTGMSSWRSLRLHFFTVEEEDESLS